MAHVTVIVVPRNAAPGSTGVHIEADLDRSEEEALRKTLDDAFNEQLIDDYGIDHVGGLVDYAEAFRRVARIIGR